MARIAVIGSGFSGLSAAAYLGQAGHSVDVFEKNSDIGGRARQMKVGAYHFDMGPSWYWMPDVIEGFFKDFGKSSSDFYELKKLDPSFDVVFGENDTVSIPSDYSELAALLETIEAGSSEKLDRFMKGAAYKYNTGMGKLAYKPGLSWSEFADMEVMKGLFSLEIFSSFGKHVRKYFSNPKILAIMEFPVLFLGAMPKDIPALYSLMNYAGLKLGTWYPMGGFSKIICGIAEVALENGARIHVNAEVEKIVVEGKNARGLMVNGEYREFDAIIASADYHHVENKLLPGPVRNYSASYWEKRVMAPSCLIIFLGLNKRIKSIRHHSLFFDADFSVHANEIYQSPKWPTRPLFYVCCPSQTDDTVAPEGHENLFLLMPLAPGLSDTREMRDKYFRIMLARLEKQVGEPLESSILYKSDYCVNDFVDDYNSFKGNAYGLANTLRQTAILKPSMRNKKVKNLFYAGQLTVPGPGVPPSIISGKIAARELHKFLNKQHEITI